MKRIAIIAILTVLCISGAQAQTFLDRLKKPTKDKAVVTITQDAAIDKLVNGNNATNATIGTRHPILQHLMRHPILQRLLQIPQHLMLHPPRSQI